jgi:hypothetical protein
MDGRLFVIAPGIHDHFEKYHESANLSDADLNLPGFADESLPVS